MKSMSNWHDVHFTACVFFLHCARKERYEVSSRNPLLRNVVYRRNISNNILTKETVSCFDSRDKVVQQVLFLSVNICGVMYWEKSLTSARDILGWWTSNILKPFLWYSVNFLTMVYYLWHMTLISVLLSCSCSEINQQGSNGFIGMVPYGLNIFN